MYLGADREELVSYMMRDQMPFDIDRYPVEKELRNVWALSLDNKNKINNEEFFNFICKKIK